MIPRDYNSADLLNYEMASSSTTRSSVDDNAEYTCDGVVMRGRPGTSSFRFSLNEKQRMVLNFLMNDVIIPSLKEELRAFRAKEGSR